MSKKASFTYVCDCRKGNQTEVIFSENAEGFVCLYCGYYPIAVPTAKANFSNEMTDAWFAQELKDLLASRNGEDSETADFVKKVKNQGALQ
jgi:ribosomal protein S27E